MAQKAKGAETLHPDVLQVLVRQPVTPIVMHISHISITTNINLVFFQFLRQSRHISLCSSGLLGAIIMFIILAHMQINQSVDRCVTTDIESVAFEGLAKNR